MLYFTYKRPKNLVYRASDFSKFYLKKDWFLDDRVVQMIRDIDKNDVEIYHDKIFIESKVLGTLSINDLSSGIRNIVMCLNMHKIFKEPIFFETAHFGSNCYPWLFKVAEWTDVYLYDNVYFKIPKYTGTNRYGFEDRLCYEYSDGYCYNMVNIDNNISTNTYIEMFENAITYRAEQEVYCEEYE